MDASKYKTFHALSQLAIVNQLKDPERFRAWDELVTEGTKLANEGLGKINLPPLITKKHTSQFLIGAVCLAGVYLLDNLGKLKETEIAKRAQGLFDTYKTPGETKPEDMN